MLLNEKILKLFILLLLTTGLQYNIFAQTPSSCFEIESILVDACGSPEGENEMVRFVVGPTALNTSNMNVNWANTSNPWLGICQNSTTANAVAALNATVQSCGLLLEPTNGVLPAGAKVLLITSTAIDVNANSFANLSDTIYVIFQCAGNTAGHFANYSSSAGLRTLSIQFSSPSGCSDAVTYDRTQLLNQNLTTGGSSASKDGALVNFDWSGNPSYDNLGCQAPVTPSSLNIVNLSPTSICPGESVQLTVTTSGTLQNLTWSGNFGTFTNSSSDTTTYISSINDTSNFYIYVSATVSCGTVSDSILITINPPAIFTQNIQICQGQTFTLPGGSVVNTQGTYHDTLQAASANGCDSVVTTNLTVNTVVPGTNTITICQGDSVFVGGAYQQLAGNYTDTIIGGSSFGCDSVLTTTLIVNASTSFNQSFEGCEGFEVVVGNNTYTSTGIYIDILTGANGCDSVVTTNLLIHPAPSIQITAVATYWCENEIENGITLNCTSGDSIYWNTGVINVDSIIVFTEGVYTVTAYNNFGCVASDEVEIIIDNCQEPTIFIPNVFTPNNDGMNDEFFVKGDKIETITTTIFNRWGNELITLEGLNEKWDGTYNDELVPSGTYFYLVEVKFEESRKEVLKGSVTLLR